MKEALTTVGVAIGAIVIGVGVYLYGNFGGPASSVITNPNAASLGVQFTKIVAGMKSAEKDRINYIITSEAQFKKLWDMVDATSTMPTIDFTKYSVMAVFAGAQTDAGYTIRVGRIQDTTKRIVTIYHSTSGAACTAKRSGLAPYELVLVPASSLPLTHEDIVTTTGCPATP